MVIGFRCSPTEITVVLLDGTRESPHLIACDRMQRPKNLSDPAFFSWVRQEITDLLTTNDPRKVAYKKAEHVPRRSAGTERRAQIEAIVELASYDCNFKQIKGLTKAQIATAINFKGKAKQILDALAGTPLQDLKHDATREAAIAAWAVL